MSWEGKIYHFRGRGKIFFGPIHRPLACFKWRSHRPVSLAARRTHLSSGWWRTSSSGRPILSSFSATTRGSTSHRAQYHIGPNITKLNSCSGAAAHVFVHTYVLFLSYLDEAAGCCEAGPAVARQCRRSVPGKRRQASSTTILYPRLLMPFNFVPAAATTQLALYY
jgi:hypothetical protein